MKSFPQMFNVAEVFTIVGPQNPYGSDDPHKSTSASRALDWRCLITCMYKGS